MAENHILYYVHYRSLTPHQAILSQAHGVIMAQEAMR